MEDLTWTDVKESIKNKKSAFRVRIKLMPAGGAGSKVYPPTYLYGKSGGVYAWEGRRIDGQIFQTVLLDSIQSQANRMEQALLEAVRSGNLSMPLLQVDLNKYVPELNQAGLISTLDAPHRIADAIFRDSTLKGKRFRETSEGKEFTTATYKNAMGMLKWCPHALIFGVWDSTGSMGGLGNKFQRAITSEIVGVNAEKGVHTSSRIDPLGITTVSDIYKDEEGNWTLDEKKAKKDKSGKPEKVSPSEIVHGNIPPSIELDSQSKEPIRGGVTIDYAFQTCVVSLPALRRLHFPIDGKEDEKLNQAARSLLAALALYSFSHMAADGYDLRSGCLLIPQAKPSVEIISNDGTLDTKSLTTEGSEKIMHDAIEDAKNVGLPWEGRIIELDPEERLITIVKASKTLRKSNED